MNKSLKENPLGNLFPKVWILLLTDPSFLEFLHHLLIMANCSSVPQKWTSHPVPLFQDVWQLLTQLMFHAKLRKENEEKQSDLISEA